MGTNSNVRNLNVSRYENYVFEFVNVDKISERTIFPMSYKNFKIVCAEFGVVHNGVFHRNGNKWYYYIKSTDNKMYDRVSKMFYSKNINKQELALDNLVKEYKDAFDRKDW